MTFKGKEVQVILSEEAAEEYNELNRIVGEELQRGVTSSVHQSIFRSIDRVKGWLKENPFAGDQVKKSQIPDYYTQKYGVTNLWRIELSNYWRLIYTIQSNEVEIIDFVLDMSEIALRTPAMLQLGVSKRFPSMLKNTPRPLGRVFLTSLAIRNMTRNLATGESSDLFFCFFTPLT